MRRKLLLIAATAISVSCSDSPRKIPAQESAASDTAAVEQPTSLTASGKVEYFSRESLSRIAESLAAGTNPTRVFGRHPTLWYVAARRSVSGSPEIHDRWIDVTFIQAGNATLVSGGSVSGSRLESAGEHRGGTISGGSKRELGAGDFLVIPAGVPHQYQLARGDSLVYLTVKVLSQSSVR